mmetsp:Transcript_35141/g.46274  ORF Transcript_35141/g.46274 Transcript_35141/m.46274 type:complete len:127 (+) Transcript_35141:42-422(+)|eukprot:CAMPEP_0185568226 /NCGR_PEP_ID=MMETSP0434-20130131/1249_1 /TAXON_ID=626734 ORGANISM="Favella taraikaensis, Strain Fe Narragansett Bay" /NCGR_SAMPLE_ID=MMETSP0434 /ASSEMBLY_ACC=CAM_ASM_000379 /LENGTH=126 /DNA_ID=CAMNT_0028182669 /DNA_START=33 /DNA_END=413 /DNA_ORIENTATION=-
MTQLPKLERVSIKADSRRMKGILQMYDADAGNGYDRVEQEQRDRSRSLGKELKDSMSEKARSRSPVHRNQSGLGIGISVPVLNNAATLPRNFEDSLKTEKRMGPDLAIYDSQSKAKMHDMELRFEN